MAHNWNEEQHYEYSSLQHDAASANVWKLLATAASRSSASVWDASISVHQADEWTILQSSVRECRYAG
ncbi:hypothetical protein [Paenibacillus solani]|uniref:hypothetical protein n=1 Tax=Paenibacillus solani TaxID=1705565 RepID=UPI003D2977B7